ncbi:MAG: hypothetical protein WA820_00865, partial [Bradyrhizobium sp.]
MNQTGATNVLAPRHHNRNGAVPMAEDAIASIFARHQPRTAKSAVPRARAYRQRRRQKPKRNTSSDDDISESLIPAGFSWAEPAFAEPPVA